MRVRAWFWSRFATFNPVVEVQIADRAQRQIVVVGSSDRLAQFFIERVQGMQMGSRRGNFYLAGAQEFLIAAVDEERNFAANDAAWPGHVGRSTVWRFCQHRATAIFADLYLICDSRRVRDIKLMGAKIDDSTLERIDRGTCFLSHRNIDRMFVFECRVTQREVEVKMHLR